MTEKSNFGVIQHRGDPTKAVFQGVEVEKRSHIAVDSYTLQGLIPTTDYGEHFIFEVPVHLNIGGSSYLCTCGSAAVIALPPDVENPIFVCHFYQLFGVHQTSVVNMDDFEREAAKGQITLDRDKLRRKRWN